MGIKFRRIYFEREALDYPLGKEMFQRLQNDGHTIDFLQSHNRVTGIPGKNAREAFFQGKNTLVVGVRRSLDFAGCKPSAHYQLPLVTGCEGICEYCYLNTQMGKKPYTRVYVNLEEIFQQAQRYITNRAPDKTIFEAAATSDPVAVEPYTGSLARAIEFFAGQELGYLRFVTKFPYINNLLELDHKGHTRIRFSINCAKVISRYEHRTPGLDKRLEGLALVLQAGYPAGVIIAPVILDDGWQREYQDLLQQITMKIPSSFYPQMEIEVISHRFTRRARSNIVEVFPETGLPMDENLDRKFKYGQFGYGKFVYSDEKLQEMKAFFRANIESRFPSSKINYII